MMTATKIVRDLTPPKHELLKQGLVELHEACGKKEIGIRHACIEWNAAKAEDGEI